MSNTEALPEGLLLAYYGDDFTGSTDAMEAMAAAGVPTALFLQTPGADALARFPGVRCVGVAGSSRSRSPEWMDAHLPAVFDALVALGAPVLHYKVCSTFDSSPQTGSIGRAIDIGTRCMPGNWSPCIVGAPRLRRYQVFGNLFAAVDGQGYRLDRHPTMSRHPVTPMHEADLRLHLAQQTARPVGLIDMVQLREGQGVERLRALQSERVPVVLLDVLDEQTQCEAGRLLWQERGKGVFSASSSGLQYALVAWWRAQGLLPGAFRLPSAQANGAIAAVSGSCSPVTAAQIRHARAHGFLTERLDLARVLGSATRDAEIERVVALAAAEIAQGRSAIVFSAEGPDDPSVTGFDAIAHAAGYSRSEAARAVGQALAAVMHKLLERSAVRRMVVAGGDSSTEVAGALGIEALTVQASLVPGAPLCLAWAADPARNGLELVLKGGQMGGPDFFVLARDGLTEN